MDEQLQHLSHRKLMIDAVPPEATASRIDAVVVPSARPAAWLRAAAALAQELARPLVVLCSRLSHPEDVVDFVRTKRPGVVVYAIDTPASVEHEALQFQSDAMSAGRVFSRHSDTSIKRNVALLLARSVGWQRIMFLDDDIRLKDAADVRRAGALLDDVAAVGLRIGGFPDNSVVCHAIRQTGGKQDTFIGAGALAVKIDAEMSFFPNIYNEDWFFLLNKKNLRAVSTTKKVVATQRTYDPFASPLRAIEEEFGDVLAEGALGILDDNGKIGDADIAYWERFIASREDVINRVMERRRHQLRPGAADSMMESLATAQLALREITPALCFDYLQAREKDLVSWNEALDVMPTDLSVPDGLAWLGLADHYLTNVDDVAALAEAEGVVRRYARLLDFQRWRSLWIKGAPVGTTTPPRVNP